MVNFVANVDLSKFTLVNKKALIRIIPGMKL